MRATKYTGWFVCPMCGGEYDRGYIIDFYDGKRKTICMKCYESLKKIKRMVRKSVNLEEAWRKLEDKVKGEGKNEKTYCFYDSYGHVCEQTS